MAYTIVPEMAGAEGVAVSHADGAELAGAVSGLEGAPGAGPVADGLVEQEEVDEVEAEAFQRGVDGAEGALVAVVLHPDFGLHEDRFAGEAALADGLADGALVEIGRGGVHHAVAAGERVKHHALGLVVVRDLEDAKAFLRHPHAIGQSQFVHVGSFLCPVDCPHSIHPEAQSKSSASRKVTHCPAPRREGRRLGARRGQHAATHRR